MVKRGTEGIKKKSGRTVRASTVVEMAYLMPLVLMVWMLVIFGLFYYHDKTILMGATYETVIVGSEILYGMEEFPQEEMENYFRERIRGKLMFYGQVSVNVYEEQQRIIAKASASAKGMELQASGSAVITEPEKQIRRLKAGKKKLEGALQ